MLHYKIDGEGDNLVLLHGLFGSLDNLGVIARELSKHYRVIRLDLSNHGLSPHVDMVSYQQMSDAVIETLDALGIAHFSLVGHSMGGKVAMQIAAHYPTRTRALAVLDMAPVAYTKARHTNVLKALNAVKTNPPSTRKQAMDSMLEHLEDPSVAQFLGKSLTKQDDGTLGWRFNLEVLERDYWAILDWQESKPFSGPTLFVIGGNSDYVLAEHRPAIARQFPMAKAHQIANAGHWLHAEKPEQVCRSLMRFLP